MKKIIVYMIILGSALLSCEDFLEEEPKSFGSEATLFDTRQSAQQVINAIYQPMTRLYRGRYFVMFGGITTDELNFVGNNSSRAELENYVFTAENGNLGRAWQTHAFMIDRANTVLDNISEEFPDLRGEALFLRAWAYFTQMRYFGPVPLLTSSEEQDLFPSNSTIAAIYEVIVADLLEAQTLLPATPNDIGRPARGAAKALLAWVYLTRASSEAAQASDYASAAATAQDVIDNEGYALVPSYTEVFQPQNEGGPEDIWSLNCTANLSGWSNSVHIDFSPIPFNPDGFGGFNNFAMTENLYNTFEPGDERLNTIIKGEFRGAQRDGSGNFIDSTTYTTFENRAFIQKFRDPESLTRNNHGTNLPLIRFANVLLVHAEAENEANGPTGQAFASLNRVRERVNLSPLQGLSQADLREAIRRERYVEFHGEGIRWFDLQRWGTLEQRVEAVKPGVNVDPAKHRYFPIPQSEIDANDNLDQNDNYE